MLELESGGVPDAPILELKTLPDSLRYEIHGPNEIFPIIISSSLTSLEVSKLLEVVRTHRKALGYSMDDLTGLSPPCACTAFTWKKTINPRLSTNVG